MLVPLEAVHEEEQKKKPSKFWEPLVEVGKKLPSTELSVNPKKFSKFMKSSTYAQLSQIGYVWNAWNCRTTILSLNNNHLINISIYQISK